MGSAKHTSRFDKRNLLFCLLLASISPNNVNKMSADFGLVVNKTLQRSRVETEGLESTRFLSRSPYQSLPLHISVSSRKRRLIEVAAGYEQQHS